MFLLPGKKNWEVSPLEGALTWQCSCERGQAMVQLVMAVKGFGLEWPARSWSLLSWLLVTKVAPPPRTENNQNDL